MVKIYKIQNKRRDNFTVSYFAESKRNSRPVRLPRPGDRAVQL